MAVSHLYPANDTYPGGETYPGVYGPPNDHTYPSLSTFPGGTTYPGVYLVGFSYEVHPDLTQYENALYSHMKRRRRRRW